ncbi:benzoate carboxyl methyltransferase-like [Macadamia integrifolia]|uniref:benzoate carboxyl methyltransferase-like n=1 Tax=Macadamia integrifolia TaxID=60698 RepID=UPI001C4E300D|nr:benzoate carboxyl methyltransferase-like [Macadamia integrifolia]
MEAQQVLHMNLSNGETSYATNSNLQVPPTVESDDKGNIYLATRSPPTVFKGYLEQFQKDFSLFLSLGSKEITPGGRMVITMLGRKNEDLFGKEGYFFELLSKALNDLVSEGLIEEAQVDSFNLPFYMPSRKELEDIVCAEGSFYLDQLDIFDVNWDGSDYDDNEGFMFDRFISAQKTAKCIRAVVEPLIAYHFEDNIIDILFSRYMENVSDHLSKEEGKFVNFVISLRGK